MLLRRVCVLATLGIAIGGGVALSAQPEAPKPSGDQAQHGSITPRRCFNFKNASAFKIISPNLVRINVGTADAYDISVAGQSCLALDTAKDLALRSAPIFDICVGAHPNDWALKFVSGDQNVYRCEIQSIQAAAPSAAAQTPQH